MENDRNSRMVQLERLLLDHGAASITTDAAGDLDQGRLISELARLGFTFRGCELHGYAWEAEFRKPSAYAEGRPVMGCASAFSEHAAVLEAAIAALRAQDQPPAGPNGGPPPAQWTTWRQSRPAPRLPRFASPALSL